MMAAMMLPGAVPAVVRRAHVSGRVRAVPLFVGSYLAVSALVGVAVFGLYRPHGVLGRQRRHRCAAGAGDHRTWNPDRYGAVGGAWTHATDVRGRR